MPRLLTLFCFLSYTRFSAAIDVVVYNSCGTTIWPALFSEKYSPATTQNGYVSGWEAAAHTSRRVQIPEPWDGLIWGRQECDENGACATGSCTGGINCTSMLADDSPATRVGLISDSSNAAGWNQYRVSLLQGFNIPVDAILNSSTQVEISPEPPGYCGHASCTADINAICPQNSGSVTSEDGNTLACAGTKSNETMLSFYQEQCPGTFDSNTGNNGTILDSPLRRICISDASSVFSVTFCPNGVGGDGSASESPGGSTTNGDDPGSGTTTGKSKLGGGAISGIVVGVTVSLAIVALSVFLLLRRKRRRRDRDFETPEVKQSSQETVDPFDPYIVPSPHNGGIHTGKMREASTVTSPLPPPSPAPVSTPPNGSPQPLPSSGPQGLTPSAESTDVDFDRLFDDRRVRGQLLNMIAQRMTPTDVQEREGSVLYPPTYHEDERSP